MPLGQNHEFWNPHVRRLFKQEQNHARYICRIQRLGNAHQLGGWCFPAIMEACLDQPWLNAGDLDIGFAYLDSQSLR